VQSLRVTASGWMTYVQWVAWRISGSWKTWLPGLAVMAGGDALWGRSRHQIREMVDLQHEVP
jgi:hypothetical protein